TCSSRSRRGTVQPAQPRHRWQRPGRSGAVGAPAPRPGTYPRHAVPRGRPSRADRDAAPRARRAPPTPRPPGASHVRDAPSAPATVRAAPEHARPTSTPSAAGSRSEEHTSELQSRENLVCRLLLEKKKTARPPTSPAELTTTCPTTSPRSLPISYI